MKKIDFNCIDAYYLQHSCFPHDRLCRHGPEAISLLLISMGLPEKTYYAALLSSVESTGPYSALDDGYQERTLSGRAMKGMIFS